ncbi:MAG: type IV pilin protein [Planctomycetota bacterium]|jgi:hypothetical protein
MSKLRKTGLAIAVVAVIGIAIVAYTNLRDKYTTEESNVVTITEALSLYWKDNGRYPEDPAVLFEKYGLTQEQAEDYSYTPTDNYGSYGLDVTIETADGVILMTLGGPPPAEMSHEALASRLVSELRMYYSMNGRYPDTLLESVEPRNTELRKAVKKDAFAYSIAEDKQSCSLDGRTIVPFPSPEQIAEGKYWIRKANIEILTQMLHTYREKTGRYPNTLQELAGSSRNP